MVWRQVESVDENNFSIVLGGPFFQFLCKAHLSGNALELVKKRVVVISLITWLPLFLLSILKGQAWGESSNLPFLEDFEVHIRFMIVMPLMIIAELVVHQRMRIMVMQFQERHLIPEDALKQFRQSIRSALRLRNSIIAEVLFIIIIYVIGYNVVWHQSVALHSTAWYTEPSVAKGHLSLAGIWFRYVSLPLFQFLFLRWYYRIFIWARFLYQVSKIKLRLMPTHPDYAGGLGFLSNSVYAFMPLAVAHGALLSGMIANRIFHQEASLLDFKIELIIITLLVLCLVIIPLFSFLSQLGDIKRMGILEYGKLATRYVQEFESRWMKSNAAPDNSMVGASDIQGLADLANSYKVVENMQILPITKNDILLLAIATVAPVLPLVLTMMSIGDLIKMLSGVLI